MIFAMIFTRLILTRGALIAIGRLIGIGLRRAVPFLFGAARRFIGFVIMSAVAWVVQISLSAIWGALHEQTYTIAYFDWNQSDNTIRNTIRANNNQIAQLLGRFAGSGLVRLAAVGTAYGMKLAYPVVSSRIAIELAEDTRGQLRGEFVSLITGVRQIAGENALLTMILAFRQRRWFGLEPRTEDGPYSSFASQIETRVAAIDNEGLRNFVTGFLEGAEDAFWDVGYIIAQTGDDMVAANKYANQNAMGKERTVIIKPDTESDEELVLSGPQQLIEQSVDQTLAAHQMLYNRDMGQIVGIPADHYPRAELQTRVLVVCFKDKDHPPFRTAQGPCKQVFYSIPDAKRGLSWQTIKNAARKFTWGPYRATALLDNRRQMAVHGSTPAEAEGKLRELVSLSTADIVQLSISDEKVRNPARVKRPTLVYPCYATLVITPTDFQGRPTTGGAARRRERRRLSLWQVEEPDNYGSLD